MEVAVADGLTFTFQPAGRPPPTLFPLRGMLESHLPWAVGPAFPVPLVGDWYCLCGGFGVRLFELRAERAFTYRQDVADVTGLELRTLRMVPGSSSTNQCCPVRVPLPNCRWRPWGGRPSSWPRLRRRSLPPGLSCASTGLAALAPYTRTGACFGSTPYHRPEHPRRLCRCPPPCAPY